MRVPDEYLVDDEALAIRDVFNATGNSLPKELGLEIRDACVNGRLFHARSRRYRGENLAPLPANRHGCRHFGGCTLRLFTFVYLGSSV